MVIKRIIRFNTDNKTNVVLCFSLYVRWSGVVRFKGLDSFWRSTLSDENKSVSVVTRCRPPEITDGKDIELIGSTSLCTHTHTHVQAGLWHGTLDICETTHTLTSDLLSRPPSSRHSLLRHVSREPVDVPNTHIHQVHAHISKHALTSTPHSIITTDWALLNHHVVTGSMFSMVNCLA